jgi:hypothetical protein
LTEQHLLWCGYYPILVDCEFALPEKNGVKCRLPIEADCIKPDCGESTTH